MTNGSANGQAGDRHHPWVLVVLQAMDAAGKDGTIKHVMSGVNPQGCQVVAFKQPSAEDLNHDFLWRCSKALPNGGGSGSSTAPTTKRSWWSGYTQSTLARALPPRATSQGTRVATTLRGHQRLRTPPASQRHPDRVTVPARLPRRAEEAVPGTPRRPRQVLEVLAWRSRRAQTLVRVPGSL